MNNSSHDNIQKQKIEWHWYHPSLRAFLILFFTLGLDVLVCYGGYTLIMAKQYSSLIILILFPVLALVLTYYQIAIFVNRTTIEVKGNLLRVFAGPLPSFPASEYILSDISGVTVEERSSKKAGVFSLKIILKSGKKRILLSFSSLEEAKNYEQKLEELLKR